MTDEERLKKMMDRLNENSYYGIMTDTEITKIVRSFIKRMEENEMKATSVQNIKNVKDICFSIENDPIERESKLTIVASTNDDIFEFEFEGSDLLQICKKVGLFTRWVKDQKIRELEKDNKDLEKDRNELNQKLYQVERDKERLTDRYKDLEKQYNDLSDEHAALRNKKIDQMRSKEKIYKDEIVALIHGVKYTVEGLVDRILELEKLKTPIIKNFADEEPSNRRDILKAAEKCVCGQREQDYGTPESNFQLIADLWNDYLKKEKSSVVVDAMDVSMMMALLKIARIRNGGGSGDSFVDLAGYAACGGEIWAGQKHQKDLN